MNQSLEKIIEDLTRPMKRHTGLQLWLLSLLLIFVVAGYGYFIQLRDGLGVTSMRDYVSWGIYISNFVFFVASSLVGMLISSVLGLLKIKWITPITRIAEFVALAFAMWAGLVIVIDMGRPDRLLNVFIYGRFQSPILWDVTVITTYVVISSLLLIIPLIPDIALLQNRLEGTPKWFKPIYKLLSFGWINSEEQRKLLQKTIRILLILIVPVALSIHTVTSWLFASTLRAGWDSTIFGPYFVAGAFPAGVGAVIMVAYILRTNFGLKEYLTEYHFNQLGKLLVLVSLVYLYFNINEYLVPAYKMREYEGKHLMELFTGSFAPLFWSVQILGLIVPIIALLFRPLRRPLPIFIIGIMVLIGAFFKRYLIVVPTVLHPFLPIQNEPLEYMQYFPSGIEIMLTIFPFAGVALIITILAKLFPVVPICETAEENGISHHELNP